MLKSAVIILIFATLAAARSPRFRIVNGEQIGTVVNGEVVNPGTFPYIVYLRTKKLEYVGRNATHRKMALVPGRCAGTIIREYAVLTAAHCVNRAKPYHITIAAGVVALDKRKATAQIRFAKLYATHEKYHETSEYDIAIVFICIPFKFNKYVSKLDFAQPNDYKIGMTAVTAGWGRNVNGSLPTWLHSTEMTLVNNSVCEKYHPIDYSSLLCLIDTTKRTTTCGGDSGGPLVKDNVLIGFVNGGIKDVGPESISHNGSCDPSFGVTFTNVASFRPWIDTKLSWYEDFLRSIK